MALLHEAFDQLDAFIVQMMRMYNTPGLALALTDREKLLRVSAYGYADVARGTPVTPETLFEIGSDGKAFTALALLQQAEAGRVDLHAPVSNYLPWFHVPSRYAPITAHHLLAHSAGLIAGSEFATDARYEVWALRETEAAHPPGQRHYYSNVGYKALGLLLERVAGQPYGAIVRRGVLDPLGMTATEPVITHATRPRLAVGYRPLYDDRPPHRTHPLVPAPWVETDTGDGCLVSTVGDMARYARMLLNRGRGPTGPLISSESFDRMTQPHSTIRPGVSYGYGLVLFDLDGHAALRHGGDMPGYESAWCADQEAGLAAIVLMNGPLAPGIPPYAVRLLRAAREQGALPPPPLPDPGRVTHAADYEGVYRAGDRTLTIAAEGEGLILHHGGACVALERRGDDGFYAPHPDFARFLLRFGRRGSHVVEVFHGPEWYVNARYDGPTTFAHPAEWAAYPGHYRAHNPWRTNFRIVIRKDALLLIEPSGDEEPLTPLELGLFRVGTDEYSPERLRFDTIVDGYALRTRASSCEYYRFFTP
jgi:CubicO group peptidase (beta-lactamase class C family)